MSIIKNQYPILEYDTASKEILKPNLNMEKIQLPEKCVYAFLGGVVDAYAASHDAICVSILHTITKDYPVYVVEYNGSPIVLCQAPLGASAAAQSMDSLIACGVRKIVSAGSCGVLRDLPGPDRGTQILLRHNRRFPFLRYARREKRGPGFRLVHALRECGRSHGGV